MCQVIAFKCHKKSFKVKELIKLFSEICERKVTVGDTNSDKLVIDELTRGKLSRKNMRKNI